MEKDKLLKEKDMGRNLDLEHCANKPNAVIAAYVEELDENDRKIAEGAWATSLDLARIQYWHPLLMTYCRNHPLTQAIQRERENMKRCEKFADVFFWSWD